MYLRKIKRPQEIYLAIQESYYDSSSKQSRTRTVESLGYLEALKQKYDDPIAFFTQKAREMTDKKKKSKSVSISIENNAKFTTCFAALVLIRLVQAKLENKYPVGKIINALKKYTCVPLDTNNYQFTYYDEVLSACQKAFHVELDNKYRTRQQVQRLLRYENFFKYPKKDTCTLYRENGASQCFQWLRRFCFKTRDS